RIVMVSPLSPANSAAGTVDTVRGSTSCRVSRDTARRLTCLAVTKLFATVFHSPSVPAANVSPLSETAALEHRIGQFLRVAVRLLLGFGAALERLTGPLGRRPGRPQQVTEK